MRRVFAGRRGERRDAIHLRFRALDVVLVHEERTDHNHEEPDDVRRRKRPRLLPPLGRLRGVTFRLHRSDGGGGGPVLDGDLLTLLTGFGEGRCLDVGHGGGCSYSLSSRKSRRVATRARPDDGGATVTRPSCGLLSERLQKRENNLLRLLQMRE